MRQRDLHHHQHTELETDASRNTASSSSVLCLSCTCCMTCDPDFGGPSRPIILSASRWAYSLMPGHAQKQQPTDALANIQPYLLHRHYLSSHPQPLSEERYCGWCWTDWFRGGFLANTLSIMVRFSTAESCRGSKIEFSSERHINLRKSGGVRLLSPTV